MPKKTKKVVPAYDSSITLKKFVLEFILVGIIASLTWFLIDGVEILTLEYPQYTLILSLITAIVVAIINYLKHFKDTELV
jgi:hypothetical protein